MYLIVHKSSETPSLWAIRTGQSLFASLSVQSVRSLELLYVASIAVCLCTSALLSLCRFCACLFYSPEGMKYMNQARLPPRLPVTSLLPSDHLHSATRSKA